MNLMKKPLTTEYTDNTEPDLSCCFRVIRGFNLQLQK